MTFLTIILALALVYYRAPLTALQSDSWFFVWLDRVSGWAVVIKIPAARLLVSLALPVVGLLLLLDLLAGIPLLLLLAIELWVLLYSFGRGDLRAELNTLKNDLRRGDTQAAFHAGEALSADKSNIVAFDLPALSQELRERVAYTYFERYLAVIFWSLLGGVGGALLYRLSVLYRASLVQRVAQSDVGEEGFDGYLQLGTASRWLALLEWLPLGLAGFTLSLVGQFGAGLSSWLKRCLSGRPGVEVLRDYVDDALDYAGDTYRASSVDIAASCERIEQLFKRVLVFWLCLLALGLVL
ncbi:MAG: regulatory signaling modulator protein AmpE [Gammaproteobacteria bacterium]|nr:regulatory signaling modulator protein AmpE [Gammaproteobacteria bacterium]MBQ0840830.1 regulatory signaling modulator protein AmpE [Gammaproteobacteria bacterium]